MDKKEEILNLLKDNARISPKDIANMTECYKNDCRP